MHNLKPLSFEPLSPSDPAESAIVGGTSPFESWFVGQVRRGLADLKVGHIVTDDAHWRRWHAGRILGVSRVEARLRLVWSVAAEADFAAILQQPLKPQPVAGVDQIEKAVWALRMHPRLGRYSRVKGTREIDVQGTDLVVVYKTAFREFVEVIRVLPAHGQPGTR